MSRILTIFVLFVLTLSNLFSSNFEVEASSGLQPDLIDPFLYTDQIVSKKLDKEAIILQSYLKKFDSPMQYHAQDFIDAARKYNLDWKMLPAIAGVESTFGKHIPGGYNAYGWGVYGTQAIYFNSWTDGIFTVAKGLREGYLNKGLTDPYDINRIYAASPHWGKNVTFFMNDLQKYAQNYDQEILVQPILPDDKIAAISASLVQPVIR
jgi:hypothetical protein